MKPNRFDYVAYDEKAVDYQKAFKNMFMDLEAMASNCIESPRAKALVLTKLEEAYMWIGKGIRDDLITRNGSAELQEGRSDS